MPGPSRPDGEPALVRAMHAEQRRLYGVHLDDGERPGRRACWREVLAAASLPDYRGQQPLEQLAGRVAGLVARADARAVCTRPWCRPRWRRDRLVEREFVEHRQRQQGLDGARGCKWLARLLWSRAASTAPLSMSARIHACAGPSGMGTEPDGWTTPAGTADATAGPRQPRTTWS